MNALLSPSECNLDAFIIQLDKNLLPTEVPLAHDIQKKIPIYDVSKLDPTMCQLFGGGEPAVLLTTNHITKILAQKAKRKRATVESGSADNSKRRAAQGGGLAPAQLTHSIAHSGLSPEQQEVLAFLTRVCMPMIKAVKADMPNASAPETC